MTEYDINYKIVSAFTTQVEADSEAEAREKFRELNMRDEVSDNILDGGLNHSEIEIVELPEVSTNMNDILNSFETVINYIESDNESDMNKFALDLIATLRELQDKVREEGEENHG